MTVLLFHTKWCINFFVNGDSVPILSMEFVFNVELSVEQYLCIQLVTSLLVGITINPFPEIIAIYTTGTKHWRSSCWAAFLPAVQSLLLCPFERSLTSKEYRRCVVPQQTTEIVARGLTT